ncbi:uncharacterized protein LOC133301494 [Gastrolobium bilobum]|uniref:uncharacterized protein LOC133301494 n=1 Tax=Gastrolobium bilobum TaxID=150636 RepID=UPI002AAF44EF|nr:uncharacterized protein LOC133301494 [Gastrolobium bilobum]
MTVDAYLAKFNKLVKFANYGGTLPTSEFLSAKFQRRLSEKIAKRMSNTAVRNFADLVTQCKWVETVYGRYPKSNSAKDQEVKRTDGPSGSNYRGGYHHNNNRGRGLLGPCTAVPNSCFKCGKVGHFARECYSNTGQIANLQALPSVPNMGRIYTTNVQQTEKAPNLVKGIIFIYNIDLSVLFDSGATHSFVTKYVAKGLNLKVTRMIPPMCITTAIGEVSDSSLFVERLSLSTTLCQNLVAIGVVRRPVE